MLAVHNLGEDPTTIDLGPLPEQQGDPSDVHADAPYAPPSADLENIELNPYGYRWIRLRSGRGK
jgi:hypothetical protein